MGEKKSVVVVPKKTTDIVVESKEMKSWESLIQQAVDKGTPVETIEKLLTMRRELKAEWAKEQYDQAMASFQSECPTIKKTKEVKTNAGAVAYKYAPIESIVEQVKDAIKNNGFSYTTSMELKENGVKVEVKVTHKSGHSEITPMEVPFGNKTQVMSQSQVAAAATTFAKRYAFCNAFGILTGDEDNDGKDPLGGPSGETDKATKGFEFIINAIKKCDFGELQKYKEKMEKSTKYTDDQKKQFVVAINLRLEELKK